MVGWGMSREVDPFRRIDVGGEMCQRSSRPRKTNVSHEREDGHCYTHPHLHGYSEPAKGWGTELSAWMGSSAKKTRMG